jgi:predicted secreted protein
MAAHPKTPFEHLLNLQGIEMMTSKILAAAALTILAAAGAQAETYDGVHALTSQRARVEVASEAVVAAHTANPYAEGASSVPAPVVFASTDRARVKAEAVATAHDPLQSLDRKAFVNSVIPAQYKNGSLALRRQARLQQQASL